jgi:hypothetical protein
MKPGTSATPLFSISGSRMVLFPVALVLPFLLVSEQVVFAQQGWPQSTPYANSQYVQPNPNYVPSQNKPSPYQYQQVDPQQGGGYGQQPAYPQAQPQYGQQPYAQQQQDYPSQPTYPSQQYGQQPYSDPGQDDPQQAFAPAQQQQAGQPFAAEQLEQLVAPIALYPDNLVAQILAASTYPAQVVAADNWIHGQGNASPDQIAYGANAQTTWDPSIKALTAFPQVLDLMNHDLRWTTDLGNAYYNQPQDVLQTIQVMRQRAQAAGNLQNTAQEQVYQNQGYIQVAPANPQVVYVPMYNPWAVYGAPVSPYPGFSLFGALASFADSGFVRFGLGIAMSAFMHTPFGWAGWVLNWLTSGIFFHDAPYYSRSTSVAHWGGGRGGYYAGRGMGNRTPNGFARPQQGYNRAGNEFGNRGFNRPEPRPENNGFNRLGEYGNRGNQIYSRPAPQNYAYNRPESYARPGGYGSSFYSRESQQYGSRGATPYARSEQFARPPATSFGRNDFSQRAYAAPRGFSGGRGYGQSFRGESSGGSHFFGGGHNSFKAPKAPKMSGGGHHGGGGGGHGHHGR